MSGGGGGKPAFWDPNSIHVARTDEHHLKVRGDIVMTTSRGSISIIDLVDKIEALTNKLEVLEQAYMELVLLGKAEEPGKIET